MIQTKKIIKDTFWELLEEKPYNKITVQDIVDRCHVNRNTFYYHFQDIRDLVEWICTFEVDSYANSYKSLEKENQKYKKEISKLEYENQNLEQENNID